MSKRDRRGKGYVVFLLLLCLLCFYLAREGCLSRVLEPPYVEKVYVYVPAGEELQEFNPVKEVLSAYVGVENVCLRVYEGDGPEVHPGKNVSYVVFVRSSCELIQVKGGVVIVGYSQLNFERQLYRVVLSICCWDVKRVYTLDGVVLIGFIADETYHEVRVPVKGHYIRNVKPDPRVRISLLGRRGLC